MENTVILAAGDFPQRPELLELLRNAAHVVCCDSAAVALLRSGAALPEVIVGDMDSLPPELRERFAAQVVHEAEQETNDLAKAFRLCLARGWTHDMVILGATGKREDHTLGNISLLMDFAKEVPGIRLFTDCGRFEVLLQSGSLPTFSGEQISIFTPDCTMPVSAHGLVYPLHKLRLERWWNGTLNEAVGSSFHLEFSGAAPVLVYRPWPEMGKKRPELLPRDAQPHLPWRKVHFCGCGGVGMAALASLLLDDACAVSGSDAADSPLLRHLRRCGAKVSVGHGAANLPEDAELLVYSSAVPADNPERLEAARRGIPQLRRGCFLARVAASFKRVVAVSGSHGKTTVTAMAAHILRRCGVDCGYLVGGVPLNAAASGAAGNWEILIAEVDESDRTQELILPEIAAVLNVDDDHSWAVGGSAALAHSFAMLSEHALRTVAWDTDSLHEVLRTLVNVDWLAPAAAGKITGLQIPGAHNRANAAMAVKIAGHFGIEPEAAAAALRDFAGVKRRLTLRASSREGECLLYEDYAHHPTELAASLDALREAHPRHRLVVFFQPHRPERLLRYGGRFAEILAHRCDQCFIVPLFMAWEQDAPQADPQQLVADVNRIAGKEQAGFIANCPALIASCIQDCFARDGVPVMVAVIGAGDIGKVFEEGELCG